MMTRWINRPGNAAIVIALGLGLTACSGPLSQFNFRADELRRDPGFTREELRQKIGVFTAPGDNNFRRVLADSFSKALLELRPDIPQIPPQEALSLINAADLADVYVQMLRDYDTSGILRKAGLQQISRALAARYLIQLNLIQYTQDSSNRFSVLGVRFVQTRSSTLKVFAQIWDGESGRIVWEGSAFVTLAGEDVREKPIPFEEVALRAWTELIKQIP